MSLSDLWDQSVIISCYHAAKIAIQMTEACFNFTVTTSGKSELIYVLRFRSAEYKMKEL